MCESCVLWLIVSPVCLGGGVNTHRLVLVVADILLFYFFQRERAWDIKAVTTNWTTSRNSSQVLEIERKG